VKWFIWGVIISVPVMVESDILAKSKEVAVRTIEEMDMARKISSKGVREYYYWRSQRTQ